MSKPITNATKRIATWKANGWKVETVTEKDKLDMIKAIEKTKKPIHPKALPISDAKRKRESKLLMELQKNHGYTMLDTIKSVDRLMWSFDFKTGSGTLTRMLRLSVPIQSALGRAMAQSDKAKAARQRASERSIKAKRTRGTPLTHAERGEERLQKRAAKAKARHA